MHDVIIGLICYLVLPHNYLRPIIKHLFDFQNFLRDLLREAKKSQEVTEDQLISYTDTMVSPENTSYSRRKDHCMAGHQSHQIGFVQTTKYV